MSLPSINADFRLSRIASLLCLLLITASLALAESPKKKFGRLADGRAYRVDASGFQLVDQVAELEVRVDELRRQLEASENEIKAQARTIENLTGKTRPAGSAGISENGISEKSLIKSAKLKRVNADEPPNCNQLVSSLYLRVATLENQLKSAKMNPQVASLGSAAEVNCPAATRQVEACDYDSEKNPLWSQVQRLQQELMSGPSKERVASQVKSLGLAEKNLRTLKSKLSEQSRETQELSEELAMKESELGSAKTQLSELSEELSAVRAENESIRSRAALKRDEQVARATQVKQSVARATASTPSARRLQQKFSRQLQQIQSLILRRKDFLDAKEARGGSYRTSPLMTANGMSLDSLRRGVAELDWSSNSATIEDGLKEITTILQKDIRNLS